MSPSGNGLHRPEPVLSRRFRRLCLEQRRVAVAEVFGRDPLESQATSCAAGLDELADIMVESAVGVLPVPLGIATGLVVDGVEHAVPMATEEPSVIAASSFAARIVSMGGGFTTWATEPVMATHVYLEDVPAGRELHLHSCEAEVRAALHRTLAAMEARGGGYRGMSVTRLPETGLVRVALRIDVRDAMGANVLNTAAEQARGVLERASGGTALMCILSNAAGERRAGARFSLPVDLLGHACPPDMSAAELARRIAAASALAREDPERAVTHNKGIMNGISAMVLATGNDTRAVEAAAHAWAARDGRYRGLSSFTVEHAPQGELLRGELELPLALGSVGGSVGFHPATAFSLRVLRRPSGVSLARIAAALGLAQNLAALAALVGAGIQRGHMRLHASRMAYGAGARGAEIPSLAARLSSRIATHGRVDAAQARALLDELRAARPPESAP